MTISNPGRVSVATQVVYAIGEAIRDAGPIPSGHLYARVMNHLSEGQYETVLTLLERSKFISRKNHLLTWIGPARKVDTCPTCGHDDHAKSCRVRMNIGTVHEVNCGCNGRKDGV